MTPLIINWSLAGSIWKKVHQWMHFSMDPKWACANAVFRWIGRYILAVTRDKVLILKPSGNSCDVFVDSDFSSNLDPGGAPDDPYTGHSLFYAGCPLIQASKLQTLIAFSSSKVECIALSTSLRETFSLWNYFTKFEMKVLISKLPFNCALQVLEDNSGAVTIATVCKQCPTLHEAPQYTVQFQHFLQYIKEGDITINTQEQQETS